MVFIHNFEHIFTCWVEKTTPNLFSCQYSHLFPGRQSHVKLTIETLEQDVQFEHI